MLCISSSYGRGHVLGQAGQERTTRLGWRSDIWMRYRRLSRKSLPQWAHLNFLVVGFDEGMRLRLARIVWTDAAGAVAATVKEVWLSGKVIAEVEGGRIREGGKKARNGTSTSARTGK